MALTSTLILYYLWRKRIKCNTNKPCKKAKKRRFWVRPIFQLRNELGAGNCLMQEMRLNIYNQHSNFFRMSFTAFDKLLSLVSPHLLRSDWGREPISPAIRLAISLRYLASGDSMVSLSYLFRVGKSTISCIISETLAVIWKVLQPLVLVPPKEEDWKKVAEGFESSWNFPNCIGAIDGKHVSIQAPPNSGSSYYNYKGNHSLVLMAIVDHEHKFLLVDIGAEGRQSDGGIFRNSSIGKKIIQKALHIPPPRMISDGRPFLPYVIVGDEAFPLLENLMRPYPGKSHYNMDQRVYNYRHSRARRLSENTFGIMVAQWRIFSKPIIAKVENVENIIKAAVCLQNFLITYDKLSYITQSLLDNKESDNIIPGSSRNCSNLRSVGQMGTNTYSRNAGQIRDSFKDYFNEEGAVPWQWNIF